MRLVLLACLLAALLAGCGSGDEPSLTEYAESLEALTSTLIDDLAAADATMAIGTPTLEDAREVLATGLEIRNEFHQGLVALDPPEVVADLHAELVDLDAEILAAQAALAARAAAAATLEEVQRSVEFDAYGATQTTAVAVCREIQAKLDATADREAFADTPWIPADLKEVVEVTFGC